MIYLPMRASSGAVHFLPPFIPRSRLLLAIWVYHRLTVVIVFHRYRRIAAPRNRPATFVVP